MRRSELDGIRTVRILATHQPHRGKNMNDQTIISNGSRAVVISQQGAHFWANLYVGARNGLDGASITPSRWEGKTLKGAQKWADKILAL